MFLREQSDGLSEQSVVNAQTKQPINFVTSFEAFIFSDVVMRVMDVFCMYPFVPGVWWRTATPSRGTTASTRAKPHTGT